jgi:surface polysaccharide O-acyltransferase-like enzyme
LVHTTHFPYYIPETITSNEAVVSNWFTVDIYGAVANMGVPLFVMLSGALLLDAAKADEPMKVFYKKRFMRIGLPMILGTIIYFAWAVFLSRQPLTSIDVLKGVLMGSSGHLWFLYLLIGLYMVTPFLRILVKYMDRRKFLYLLIIWLVGNVAVPFINQFASFGYNPVMFVITGWVGYFLLGAYLVQVKVKRWVAAVGLVAGLGSTLFGSWLLSAAAGIKYVNYFHEPLNLTLIVASTSMFLLLTAIPKTKIENINPTLKTALHWISKNTLPIYIFHIIVMQTLEIGYLGITLNQGTLNPIIEIPLLAIIVFFLTVVIIYPLKKIPYLKYAIG